MKLVIIFGPGAVGKMTVGQELSKITNLRLFHNHMSIEFVIDVFGEYNPKVISKIRDLVLNEFIKTDNDGMIFTLMWAFDSEYDWKEIQKYYDLVKSVNGEVYFVELESSQETRLNRNNTPSRLNNKPSKRNIDLSNQRLISADIKYRLNSYEGEVKFNNYIKINNENMEASEVAKIIKVKFDL